ncbi:superoxide dismutase [Fe], chloroplastic-like [Benincasa hispida]|uniref:superoxide dismutase [Fe], chloroplastic-like n=1 Tax=Benincasa hispida TaxID=102211 RepID=UPI0019009418|nr:superoxide dismutase [Fe], chloroplastic-like [Benincasa hispida]
MCMRVKLTTRRWDRWKLVDVHIDGIPSRITFDTKPAVGSLIAFVSCDQFAHRILKANFKHYQSQNVIVENDVQSRNMCVNDQGRRLVCIRRLPLSESLSINQEQNHRDRSQTDMASIALPLSTKLQQNQLRHSSFRGSPLPQSAISCSSNKQKQHVSKTCLTKITAKFDLKPPPYPLDALEPHMSRSTLEYHWGKHHRAYVDNLNRQIEGTELEELSLEDIITKTYNKGDILPQFNNAAQIWNHDFLWESIKPGGGGKPTGELLELIERDFGSFEKFLEEFKSAAATQFGSGWAWLAYKDNTVDHPRPSEKDKKLVILKSPNAVNPLVWDYAPLLTIDVWEHAYYLDFQNRRPDYISTFVSNLISWEAADLRLQKAKVEAAERAKEKEKKKEKKKAEGSDEDVYVDSSSSESDSDSD